jgi:hypothetical protein
MSNLFLNLPVPVSTGNGAAVDVSSLGATKTIIVGGPFKGAVTIEYATDDVGAGPWAPVPSGTFQNPGRVTLNVVAHWMRASMNGSGSANADVGGENSGALFALVGVTPVDISALPPFKTVIAPGALNVEVSLDGISWSQVFSFQRPGGAASAEVVAQFARVLSGGPVWIGGASTDDGDAEGCCGDIIFRPYRPDGSLADASESRNNVFTTWPQVIAQIEATKTNGIRKLYFDFFGSTTLNPPSYGSPSWQMPDGTWDMKNVTWSDIPSNTEGFDGGNCVFFSDACHVKNLSKVDGNSLIIMNSSTVNTPITLDAGCSRMHLSGFVMFCNDSIAEYHPNPDAYPVIKYADPDAFYQIYSDSPQAMLGLYGQGPQTYQDTNTPPPPILDLNGSFSFLRCQFNTKAVTSSTPGAVVTIERVSDEIGCGFNIQNWEFVNPANITVVVANFTRVSYWNDNNQGDPVGLGVISPASFTADPRSGQYQPYPPAAATHYLALHNQVIFCDPTAAGGEDEIKMVIELPTALRANGEVIKIVDVTGAASGGSPIIVRAKDNGATGERIINGAAPATSISLTTPWVAKEFICNGLGQWIAV